MKTSLFSWRTFLRIIIMFSLIGMLVYTALNTFLISRENGRVQYKQIETLTDLLLSQSALSASELLKNDDSDSLTKLANQIASERLVSNAAIYNSEGVLLASNDQSKTVREILGIETPLKTTYVGKELLVKPIFIDDEMLGFIRITFEKSMVTAVANHHYRNSERRMYMMLILSFVSGVLLSLLILYKPKEQIENILIKDL